MVWSWWLPILLASLLLGFTDAATTSFTEELAQAPKCALTCAFDLLSTTSCSLTDSSCLCADVKFTDAVKQCVLANCTVRDALRAQTVLSTACDVPVRDQGPIVLGIAIAFAIPSILVCGIRLVCRARGAAWLGIDDVFIFLAVALVFPVTAAVVLLVKNGLGKDVWGVNVDDIDTILYWYFIAEVCYISITSLTKMSVLCFYLRVFPNKSLRRNTYIVLGITVAAFVTYLFGAIFQCSPVSVTWKGWDGQHPGHCVNVKALLYAQAITTIVLDIPVLLIPMPALKDLALPKARKIGLIFVFSLGVLTTIVCILRFQGLVKFTTSAPDFTYDLSSPGYWSLLEIHIGILCVCLPTIRPFFRAISQNLCGTPQNTGYGDYMPSDHSRPVRIDQDVDEQDENVVGSRLDSNSESTELVEINKEEEPGGFSYQATKPLH